MELFSPTSAKWPKCNSPKITYRPTVDPAVDPTGVHNKVSPAVDPAVDPTGVHCKVSPAVDHTVDPTDLHFKVSPTVDYTVEPTGVRRRWSYLLTLRRAFAPQSAVSLEMELIVGSLSHSLKTDPHTRPHARTPIQDHMLCCSRTGVVSPITTAKTLVKERHCPSVASGGEVGAIHQWTHSTLAKVLRWQQQCNTGTEGTSIPQKGPCNCNVPYHHNETKLRVMDPLYSTALGIEGDKERHEIIGFFLPSDSYFSSIYLRKIA